jgi:cytochrome c oxidase subunit 2
MTDALAQRGFYNSGKILVGPLDRHIDIVLKGIPGTPMPAFGPQLSDPDIAAIITYERNSFGNQTGDIVQPSAVKAARSK